MQTVTDLEWEHAQLLAGLVERCEAVASSWDSGRARELVGFLEGPFAAHARAEQEHFYPAVDTLLRLQHGRPTETMRSEHRTIADLIDHVAGLVCAYEAAGEEQRPGLHAMLFRAAIQLEAVARMHMEAEERAYLPLLVHLGADERAALLQRMHSDAAPAATAART